jgi:hypothetical protein
MVFEYFASRRGDRGRHPIHVNDSCPELVQSPPHPRIPKLFLSHTVMQMADGVRSPIYKAIADLIRAGTDVHHALGLHFLDERGSRPSGADRDAAARESCKLNQVKTIMM